MELWFEGERLRFRAPKGSLTAELRARLAASRTEVLAQLRAAAAAQVQIHPLSYSQQCLWFLSQEDRSSAAYNVAFAARVVSPVDVVALRQALQALVDRHGALRTTFGLSKGVPCQRVAGTSTAALEVHEVAGLDEAKLRARVDSDYRRPFDLERGPLFRAALYTRAPEDHVLLLVMHHIAVDGFRSLLLLLDELQALHREAMGGPAGIPRETGDRLRRLHRGPGLGAGRAGGRAARRLLDASAGRAPRLAGASNRPAEGHPPPSAASRNLRLRPRTRAEWPGPPARARRGRHHLRRAPRRLEDAALPALRVGGRDRRNAHLRTWQARAGARRR